MTGHDAAAAHRTTILSTPGEPADGTQRTLRADAARNRDRILAAAQELIAARGENVSMDDIAARAGVGMGTVYRRFPTKEALVEQLIGDVRLQLLRAADDALDAADGRGLEVFLRACGSYFASQPGCVAALWQHSAASTPSVSAAVTEKIDELVDRARDHQRVAPDVGTRDVIVLLRALHALIGSTHLGTSAWERHLDVHLAGLAVGAPSGGGPNL